MSPYETFDELKRITFEFATHSGGSWTAIKPPYDMASGVVWALQDQFKLAVSCTIVGEGKVEVVSSVIHHVKDNKWQWGRYIKNGVMFSPYTIFKDTLKDVQVERNTLLEVLEEKRRLCVQKYEEWWQHRAA